MGRHDLNKKYNNQWFGRRGRVLPYAPIFAEAIVNTYNPKSAIDCGCGIGQVVDALLRRGIDVVGIEGSPACYNHLVCPKDKVMIYDLRDDIMLDRQYDLCISVEVSEHIESEYVDNYVNNLTQLSDRLFTTICTEAAGWGHYTLMPREWWDEKFAERGYVVDTDSEQKAKPILTWIPGKAGVPLYADNLRCYKEMK